MDRGGLLIAAIIVANFFSESDFAKYSYFQLTVTMLAMFLSMGFQVTASKKFAKFKYEGLDSKVGSLWVISCLLSSIVFIVFFLIGDWFYSGFKYSDLIFSLAIFFVMLNIVPSGAVTGLSLFRFTAVLSTLSFTLLLTGIILSGLLKDVDLSILVIMFYFMFQFILNTLVVVKNIGLKKLVNTVDLRLTQIRKIGSEIAPLVGVSIYGAISIWFLGVIILNYNNDYQFSLFVIGVQWYALTLFFPSIISRVLMPTFVDDIYNKKTNENLMRDLGKFFIILVLISLLLSLMSPFLIGLYGKNYDNESWILLFFIVAAIIYSPINIINNYLIAKGMHKIVFFNMSIWFGSLVIFIILLYLNGLSISALQISLIMFLSNTVLLIFTLKSITRN